jgi:hypothetical protein
VKRDDDAAENAGVFDRKMSDEMYLLQRMEEGNEEL